MIKTVTQFLLIIIFSLLMMNIWMYFQQPGMIFFPSPDWDATPESWGLVHEEVTINSADGIQISGWFFPQPQSDQVLLFFHGNAGNISHRGDSIALFHRLGLNVLIIDYRGYGKSQGKPDEKGLIQDAMAAWHFLNNEKGFAPDRVILFGRSLGGAVATQLATRVKAGGLIIESTFSSARDFAHTAFPLLSRLLWLRYDFNTANHIQFVAYPVLVLHSPNDEIIPFHLGEKVYQHAVQPKQFFRLRGDHNSGFLQSQPDYEQILHRFIRTL